VVRDKVLRPGNGCAQLTDTPIRARQRVQQAPPHWIRTHLEQQGRLRRYDTVGLHVTKYTSIGADVIEFDVGCCSPARPR
jgi:hypothetical protein